MTKKEILSAIISRQVSLNPDKNGYVIDNDNHTNNLVSLFDNWNEIKSEIESGSGHPNLMLCHRSTMLRSILLVFLVN